MRIANKVDPPHKAPAASLRRRIIFSKALECGSFSEQLPFSSSHVLARESGDRSVSQRAHALQRATTNLNFTQAEIGVYYPVSCEKIRNRFRLFFQNSNTVSSAGVLHRGSDKSFGWLRERVGRGATAADAGPNRDVELFSLGDDGKSVFDRT